MQLSDRENELINKYLDREVSENELSEIEGLKSSSALFREELLKQKAIISSLKAQEKARKFEAVRAMVAAQAIEVTEDLDEDLLSDDDETTVIAMNTDRAVGSSKDSEARPPYFRYAAAIAVILTVVVLLYTLAGGGMSNDEIFMAYYQPLEASVSTRSETQDKVENPLDPYIAGDYEASITALEKAIGETENGAGLSVYLGISLMEVGRLEEARGVFQEIFAQYPNDFSGQHAEWYLALMLLKEDPDEARKAFQQIANQQGTYENQARKVLEEM